MPLETLNQFTSRVSDLPDKPNTQMTAAELKAQFDAAPEEMRAKYNALVNVLKSSTAGDSGAENIGSTNISGVAGNTVHGQLKDVFDQLKAVVLGQVPNKSITREKFADGAVDFSPVQLEIANLNLQLAASQLVPSGKTYGWDPKTSFGVIVDFTKGKTTAQLNAGDTSLEGKVTMSQGTFVAGKKVTVIGRNPADDSIVKEQATITSVSPLTISPLVNSYKSGAWIKRSTANNTTNGIKFGGVDDSVIKSVTDATAVNSAYDTSGNGGRKLVKLSNGWLVAVVKTTDYFYFYKTEKGDWSDKAQLCFVYQSAIDNNDITLSVKGNRVYALLGQGSSSFAVYSVSFDATTVQNVDLWNNGVLIDNSQTALGNVSLAINEAGTELHAAWASKNSTYSSSFNVRYAKGVINQADGSVTWGAVEQWTTFNTTGSDCQNPTIFLVGNRPVVIEQHTVNGGAKSIMALSPSGLANAPSGGTIAKYYTLIYSDNTYAQSSPSAIFVPQSVNGLANGRIWVAWHGRDATHTTIDHIRVSYSDDGGVTWSAMQKLTNDSYRHDSPSLTANKNGELFIVCMGTDASDANYDVQKIKYSSGSWGSIQTVTAGTTNNKYRPSALFDISMDFSEPLFIYQDLQNSKVGFYGTWTIGTETPITENTLRVTLTQQAKEVMTYLHHAAGLTATAQVNGNVMDKTTTADETQFTKVLGSLQDIEIEITLTRASVNDDITIDKILGGVA